MERVEGTRSANRRGGVRRRARKKAPGGGARGNERGQALGRRLVECPCSVLSAGLVRALEKRATVHQGPKPPEDVPSCVILCANSPEGLSERVEFYRERSQGTPPIVVFGPQLDLPLARDALQAGASGFVHAEMKPDQLLRALAVAAKGELVGPKGAAWVRVDQRPIR